MIDDILGAAFEGARAAVPFLEAELARLREGGMLSEKDVESLGAEVRALLEARSKEARERVGPLLSAAHKTFLGLLGLPSREDVRELTDRLDRIARALERIEPGKNAGEAPPRP